MNKRYAIIIGTNAYEDDSHKLNYSLKDANDIKTILLNRAGFNEDNIHLMLLNDFKQNNIKEALKTKFDTIKKSFAKNKDMLFVYFSGHGIFNKNEDASYLELSCRETISIQEVFTSIQSISPKASFVIIDSCHSGTSLDIKGKSREINKIQKGQAFNSKGSYCLFASSHLQEAFEPIPSNIPQKNKIQNGLLTHFLIEVFNDRTKYTDDFLSFGTISDYVSSKVSRYTKFEQTPITDSLASVPYPLGIWKSNLINSQELSILHISDIRYTLSDKKRLDKLVRTLRDDSIKVDFIFCCGNLIAENSHIEINDAYTETIVQLSDFTTSEDNIIVSQGINELEINNISRAVTRHLADLKDNEDIEKFIKNNKTDYNSCLKSSMNFIQAMGKKNPLIEFNISDCGSKKIAIVNINIFWAYNIETKTTLFPVHILEEVITQIKNVDYRILVLGGRLEDFKHFNRNEIETLIYSNFDFAFLGGIKLNKYKDIFHTEDGLALIASPSYSMYGINFSIINLNFNTNKVKTKAYINDTQDVLTINDFDFTLPYGDIKKKQIKLLLRLKKLRERELEKGNKLFVHYDSDTAFLDLFVNPILKTKTKEHESYTMKPSIKNSYFDKLLSDYDNNYVIFGKDKTGKSSLLVRLVIECFDRFFSERCIPLYIDLSEYKFDNSKFNLPNILKNHLEASKSKVDEFLQNYKLRLFLDNFNPEDEEISDRIREFIQLHQNTTYLLTLNETSVQSFEYFNYINSDYKKLFIQEIGRTEIFGYVDKSFSINRTTEIKEDIVERIVKIFKQYNIPFNYWAVALIVEIFKRRNQNDVEVQNNSELVQLFIQEALGQANLAHTNEGWKYTQYVDFLSELAYHLYKNCSNTIYSIDQAGFISFTNSFISKSSRYKTSKPIDVFNYLNRKGVITMNGNELYGFRLLGVFEYFLAEHIHNDKDFLREILSTPSIYLSFKNEMDLYSSLHARKDIELLKEVFNISQKAFKPYYDKFLENDSTIDKVLSSFPVNNSFVKLLNHAEIDSPQPLSMQEKNTFLDTIKHQEEQYVTEDEGDNLTQSLQQVKRIFDENVKEQEKLERYLFILGRVFRNINPSSDEEEKEMLHFFIKSSCLWGFTILEDINNDGKEKMEEEPKMEKLYKAIFNIMNEFIPIIVQDSVFNIVGTRTLDASIDSLIKDLEVESKKHQFELFILYFLYLDLGINNRSRQLNIDKLMNIVNISAVKSSIFMKILYYIIFKCSNNKTLYNIMIDKFRIVQIKLFKSKSEDVEEQINKIKNQLTMSQGNN